MTRSLNHLLGRRMRRFGVAGAVGAAAWGVAVLFYFLALLPAQQRLAEVRLRAASIESHATQAGRSGTERASEQLAEFYRLFPDETSAPNWIGKIAAIAETCGLSLEQGEYQAVRERTGHLTRFQMTLPLRGEYRQIRQFLARTRVSVPVVSLEQVQFERQKVGDPLVDARVRLVLYLERSS